MGYHIESMVCHAARRWVAPVSWALALLSACFGGDSNLPLGSSCTEDDDCSGDLVCQYGRCRSVCDFDHECPDGAYCVAVPDDPDVRVCTLVDEGCGESGGRCPEGLECIDGACLNPCDPNVDDVCGDGRECINEFCIEIGSCTTTIPCRFDCICIDGRCRSPEGIEGPEDYCIDGVDPTTIDGDIVITTPHDEADCEGSSVVYEDCAPDGNLSLREALHLAAALPGPNHIVVSTDITDKTFAISLSDSEGDPVELPPVPSVTYLDGGPSSSGTWDGMTIVDDAQLLAGLTLEGDLSIASGVEVLGFSIGLRVASNSRDVHLFHIRAIGNDEGVVIEPGCRDVTLGLGRELEGIEPQIVDFPQGYNGINPSMSLYGWNVIIGSNGHGIHATGVRNLTIYGTSIGYDNINSVFVNNAGRGIVLDDVHGATIGAQQLEPGEIEGLLEWRQAYLDPGDPEDLTAADPSQAYVVVCRNDGGGVLIDGGGDITMPGIMIGEIPAWQGEGTNGATSLRVVGTEGPVTYGPSMTAEGDSVLLYSFIYSTSGPSIEVQDTEGEFAVRATQIVQNWSGSHSVLTVTGATAALRWYHVTVAGAPTPRSYVDVTNSSGTVEIVNTMVWDGSVVLLSGDAGALESAILRGNARLGDGPWCGESCDTSNQNTTDIVTDCRYRGVLPTEPACAWLDLGVPTELDVNGSLAGDSNGCGPDVGAFECMTDACIPCDS